MWAATSKDRQAPQLSATGSNAFTASIDLCSTLRGQGQRQGALTENPNSAQRPLRHSCLGRSPAPVRSCRLLSPPTIVFAKRKQAFPRELVLNPLRCISSFCSLLRPRTQHSSGTMASRRLHCERERARGSKYRLAAQYALGDRKREHVHVQIYKYMAFASCGHRSWVSSHPLLAVSCIPTPRSAHHMAR